MMRLAAMLVLLAGPLAGQELAYSDQPTLMCLQTARDFDDRKACIGEASTDCINTPQGGSTLGMSGCLDAELQLWDGMLNDNYRRQMALARQADIDNGITDYGLPSQATALRDMQRAWINYRDAACDYERSRWGGGTGGGPATLACLMELTAAQALTLGRDY